MPTTLVILKLCNNRDLFEKMVVIEFNYNYLLQLGTDFVYQVTYCVKF